LNVIIRNNLKLPNGIKISSIITMAEALSNGNRQKLSEFFNCPVFSRYSNSENGYFGCQLEPNSEFYTMNTSSFIIEILGLNSDINVSRGERGRVVITDLYNYANPLIRYDTGDIAVVDLVEVNGQMKNVFTVIEGRLLDFIKIDDKIISPHTVDYALRTIGGLNQFQLHQKSEYTFILRLNTNNLYRQHDEIIVKERIRKYLGPKANIEIQYHTEIPLLSSGKRKIVMSDIN
jgi:phenylacetate-CoA ligase